jgi:hypothetical protein
MVKKSELIEKSKRCIVISKSLLYYMFFMFIFINLSDLAYSQSSDWSENIQITNSKSEDHHPSMIENQMYFRDANRFIMFFDRTDSTGTNIYCTYPTLKSWSQNTQRITNEGHFEYPSGTLNVVVFQSKEKNCSNIYSSTKSQTGWSIPVALTSDTNKYNINPKLASVPSYSNGAGIVWERNKKIYFRKYAGQKWLEEKQVTPDDSFFYSNPAISCIGAYDTINTEYCIAFERFTDSSKKDIYYTTTSSNIFRIFPIANTDNNRNPRFLMGAPYLLTWEKKINDKWKIVQSGMINQSDAITRNHIIRDDSLTDYSFFKAIAIEGPCMKFNKDECPDCYDQWISADIYQINRNNNKQIIIENIYCYFPDKIIIGENPVISHFYSNGKHSIWVAWESKINGYTNIFGTSFDLIYTSIEEKNTFVTQFKLMQNYPNPFNPVSIISYQLSNSSYISLKVYNILGNEIRTLVNEKQTPGEYRINFNGEGLPSGIYFYRLSAGNYSEVRSMILLK